jgi:hypothetical protein
MLVDTADLEGALNETDEATSPDPTLLKVVYNWFTDLNKKVPLDGK